MEILGIIILALVCFVAGYLTCQRDWQKLQQNKSNHQPTHEYEHTHQNPARGERETP